MIYALPICILLLFISCIVSICNARHLDMRGRMITLFGMFFVFPLATLVISILLSVVVQHTFTDQVTIINKIISIGIAPVLFLSLAIGGYFLYFYKQLLPVKEYRIMMIESILYFFLVSCFFVIWEYVNTLLFAGFAVFYVALYRFHIRWAPYFYYSVIVLSLIPVLLVFILPSTSCGMARNPVCTCKGTQVTVHLSDIVCIGEGVEYIENYRGGK